MQFLKEEILKNWAFYSALNNVCFEWPIVFCAVVDSDLRHSEVVYHFLLLGGSWNYAACPRLQRLVLSPWKHDGELNFQPLTLQLET